MTVITRPTSTSIRLKPPGPSRGARRPAATSTVLQPAPRPGRSFVLACVIAILRFGPSGLGALGVHALHGETGTAAPNDAGRQHGEGVGAGRRDRDDPLAVRVGRVHVERT